MKRQIVTVALLLLLAGCAPRSAVEAAEEKVRLSEAQASRLQDELVNLRSENERLATNLQSERAKPAETEKAKPAANATERDGVMAPPVASASSAAQVKTAPAKASPPKRKPEVRHAKALRAPTESARIVPAAYEPPRAVSQCQRASAAITTNRFIETCGTARPDGRLLSCDASGACSVIGTVVKQSGCLHETRCCQTRRILEVPDYSPKMQAMPHG